MLAVSLALCAGQGCANPSHAAAASDARALCHQLRTTAPSGSSQVRDELLELKNTARKAANKDKRWRPLASALADQYAVLGGASAGDAGQSGPLIARVQSDEQDITHACTVADPQDAWGHSVYVPSDAMSPTIKAGDTVTFDPYHSTTQLRRGVVIIFRAPPSWSAGNQRIELIKRVIGVGGDHVVCCDGAGRITINGAPLTEPYLYPGATPSDTLFDVTVPPGRLWVMGDNRSGSADSRAHLTDHDGTITVSDVVGVVARILLPAARASAVAPG